MSNPAFRAQARDFLNWREAEANGLNSMRFAEPERRSFRDERRPRNHNVDGLIRARTYFQLRQLTVRP